MRLFQRNLPCAFLVAAMALVAAFASPAHAVANHVVIGEICTRGSSATDEFVELYNPTENSVDISGWKIQYKSATGSTWSDRATLLANSTIAPHGFYLVGPSAYVGSPTPDLIASAWTTGLADAGGHVRIINTGSVQIDKVGWGTAADAEGIAAAPTHTAGNSIERKAKSTSTADDLAAGGVDNLLGNGEDTDVNGNDWVNQSHGRNPQSTLSNPEPAFSVNGNGTGHATAAPPTVFANHAVPSLTFTFSQDSAYTLTRIAVIVPSTWTWSHQVADVSLGGPGFAGAVASLNGDSVFVDQAAVTTTDGGTLGISNLTSPLAAGLSQFKTFTAATGSLTQIAAFPQVRVLELVPIVVVHVNDSQGVPVSPYAIGAEATVTGTVTADFYDASTHPYTDVYLQDGTAGINLFNFSLPAQPLQVGDSLTVTGVIQQFHGLTEITPDLNLITVHAQNVTLPDPLVLTCAQVNATFHTGDGTEPNEGRLIRINGVSYSQINSTITDATGTTNIFLGSLPTPPAVFDVIGILKQYKPPATPSPPPPYTADYEIQPRTNADIIAHPGPVILTVPYEDNIKTTSVRLNWTTDVASSSIVHYGTTPSLGSEYSDPTAVTTHALTVPGLTPATAYYYSVGSEDVQGSNFSATRIFSTASTSTQVMHAYFNHSVNTALATIHQANGNADLTSLLKAHIDAAQHSIDAALYSLDGTPGATLSQAIINAKNRGVLCRVICEADNFSTNAGFTALVSAGVPFITDQYDPVNNGLGLMHNKFFVIDGRGGDPDQAWVWTGSWNPTDPGTNNDYQNAIEIQDQALANTYVLEFNEMWGSATQTPSQANCRFGPRKLDNTPHKFAIGGRDVQCYFSPSDGVTSQIVSLINSADTSIGFELLTITRSDIADALIAKMNAGRVVRGDLDNGTDTGSQYNYLVSAGVDVKLKTGGGGLLHHKYMIVDAEDPNWSGTTLTGSHNWSSAAENNNNENTLVIHDPDITNQYYQEFGARYVQFGGTNPPPVTGVEIPGVPREISLAQNFPNPVREGTHIDYAIPSAQQVTLKLYDLQGRVLKTLVDERQAAGRYSVSIGTQGLSAGVYFYRLDVGGTRQERKLLVLR